MSKSNSKDAPQSDGNIEGVQSKGCDVSKEKIEAGEKLQQPPGIQQNTYFAKLISLYLTQNFFLPMPFSPPFSFLSFLLLSLFLPLLSYIGFPSPLFLFLPYFHFFISTPTSHYLQCLYLSTCIPFLLVLLLLQPIIT